MNLKIKFQPVNPQTPLKFVVLQSTYKGKWVFVRHQDRTTWEIPGGHIDPGETPDEAARRELLEEAGATEAEIKAVCDYEVSRDGVSYTFGRLFVCEIFEMNETLDHEIVERQFRDELPDDLTYPEIQRAIHEYIVENGFNRKIN